MIYGNISSAESMAFPEGKIKQCLEYAKSENILSFEPGTYKIEGDDLFVNIVSYETKKAEERFWEAHKQYLDVHLMLNGQEQIDVGFIQNMTVKDYVEQDDFLPMDGEKQASVVMNPGDFLVCYPEDGHRTAVAVKEPEQIKKAIFKVRI